MAPGYPILQHHYKPFIGENNIKKKRGKRDFDPQRKPSSNFLTRLAFNNSGLVCLVGILIFPILLGIAVGYGFMILGVGAYKKMTAERTKLNAAKEAQKIQVVLGDKVVDSSFPKTVSLNVQESKNRSFSGTPPARYYYHRLCTFSNELVNGEVKKNFDESSISEDDVDNRSRDKLTTGARDNVESDSSTHASLEDNLDKTEDEGDKELESVQGETGDSVTSCEGNSPVKNNKPSKQNFPDKKRLDLPEKSSKEIDLKEITSIEEDKVSSPDNTDGNRGRIRFALHYNVAKTELQVNIIKAINLPITDNKQGISSMVKLSLLPQQFCWQRTKTVDGTPDPVFNETFVVSGFSKDRLKEYELKFKVVNFQDTFKERFGDDVIGEILFPLSELKLMDNSASFSITKWLYLKPPIPFGAEAGDLGELCVSLCFRPISGRLIITVTKIRGLPKATADRTDPYVKLALYCDGVRMSKANTRVKRRSLNPVYNEKFNFNVSADQISMTTVVLKIVNHSEINVGGGSLGSVILGYDSLGSGQEQWKSMIESPSRHIEKWHKLHKDIC
ncbi:synaptotagmin-4-like isoform X1 [Montipora foliosa]|uniref:synaptotagmin-4-like isoform X1 n=2 Tax=Montipora foliosa TaxID=591990 RepID=UPI0035F1AC6B